MYKICDWELNARVALASRGWASESWEIAEILGLMNNAIDECNGRPDQMGMIVCSFTLSASSYGYQKEDIATVADAFIACIAASVAGGAHV